jgi:exopolysaccharide biosynthesis polyprenyl glycosylphosphotransferase
VGNTSVENDLTAVLPARHTSTPVVAASPDVQVRLHARRRQIRSLRRLLVLVDLMCTAAVVAVGLAAGREVVSATAVAVFLAVVTRIWAADSARSILAPGSVVRPALLVTAAACVLAPVVGSRADAREILLGAASTVLVLFAARCLFATPALATRSGLGQRRRLIVGDPEALEGSAKRRAPAEDTGQVILVVTRADPGRGTPVPDEEAPAATQRRRSDGSGPKGPTGLVERVVRSALDNGAERVTVIPGNSWRQQHLRELSWLLEGTGIDMVISTSLDGIAPHRVGVVQQDGRLMIKVGSASPRGVQALVKGAIDRLGAAGLLLVSAPVLLAITAAVRLDSTGPAVFRQTRVREGGGTFTMYKFRTMSMDAERLLSGLQELNMHGSDRPLFKMEEDPRITRVGHLLRKTSLDELPQLVNVLKGQMSLIGPRPALPIEVEMYDYVARRRLAVKPGMTGLWQVSGRSRLSWDESIGFDLDYVDNWSPGADAAIALRTFRAVVTKDGAF